MNTMAHSSPPRRYLDHAATSWPKPEPVWQAWEQAARVNGTAAGRGGYREAVAASQTLARTRAKIADLLGFPVDRIALPTSATLGLNQAIQGLTRPGCHVIATAADHNATLRPLAHLARRGQIDLTIVPCDGRGWVDPEEITAAWRPTTRLVTFSQASNVTGVLQDAAAIAAIARERGGLSLLDAAQTLGQIPVGDGISAADVIVAPAHKWLQGMHGVAILAARDGVECEPLILGGTGSASESLDLPTGFAEQFEAGTPDLPAVAAVEAAAGWLAAEGPATVAGYCRALAQACREQVAAIDGVRVIGGAAADAAGPPLFSITAAAYEPAELASLLEQLAGVQVRSGFHCAARIHDHLGTATGGTVRIAFGPFNTSADVDAVVSTTAAVMR